MRLCKPRLYGGDDSLVVASLRWEESRSLNVLAIEASGEREEKELLYRRSWAALVSVIPLLLRRIEVNTLLPGTLREEELDYAAHVQAAIKKAKNKAVPSPAGLRALASTMGYGAVLDAIFTCLNLLPLPWWPSAQKKMVQVFVLRGLDVIPLTVGVQANLIDGEVDLVAIIEENMNPHNFEPTFCASVLRKWRSNAVSNVLQARGVLQTGIAVEQIRAEFEALKRADVAKHGLRDCALPSCSKTEKTVKEYAGCSGCRSVVYCCLEHQALDWRAHKKACREKEAAQLAEEEGADEEAGAGAAAA